jgi:hypothetical protein
VNGTGTDDQRLLPYDVESGADDWPRTSPQKKIGLSFTRNPAIVAFVCDPTF